MCSNWTGQLTCCDIWCGALFPLVESPCTALTRHHILRFLLCCIDPRELVNKEATLVPNYCALSAMATNWFYGVILSHQTNTYIIYDNGIDQSGWNVSTQQCLTPVSSNGHYLIFIYDICGPNYLKRLHMDFWHECMKNGSQIAT